MYRKWPAFMLLLVGLLVSVGCSSANSGRTSDDVVLDNGYAITLNDGWGAERTGDEYWVLKGPDGESAKVYSTDQQDADELMGLYQRLIDKGDLDGTIRSVDLDGRQSQIMIGVLDESTGEHWAVVIIPSAGNPAVVELSGSPDLETLTARNASANEFLNLVLDLVGIQRIAS